LTPPTRESTTQPQPQLGHRSGSHLLSVEPAQPMMLHSNGQEGLPLVSALTTSVEATTNFRGGVHRVAPPASTITQQHQSESLNGPGHQNSLWMETLASPGTERYTAAGAAAGGNPGGEPFKVAPHPVTPASSLYHPPPALTVTPSHTHPQPASGSIMAVG
jgi:hypothetical protein